MRGEAGEEEDYQVHAVAGLFTAGRQDEPVGMKTSARAWTQTDPVAPQFNKKRTKKRKKIWFQGIIGCIYTDLDVHLLNFRNRDMPLG